MRRPSGTPSISAARRARFKSTTTSIHRRDYAVMSGVITNGSGTAGINKTGDGLLMLTGINPYNGPPRFPTACLQADERRASTASLFSLNGGVLQSNTAIAFTRSLGTTAARSNGPPTAAVSPRRRADDRQCRRQRHAQHARLGLQRRHATSSGPLKFGSVTSAYATTFHNPIDLNGADRMIKSMTTSTAADTPWISGVISNSPARSASPKPATALVADRNQHLQRHNGDLRRPAASRSGRRHSRQQPLKPRRRRVPEQCHDHLHAQPRHSTARVQWTVGGGGFSGGAGA